MLLVAGIERDAVNIFTKYIAKDAEQPIGVHDALREHTISKYSETCHIRPPLTQEKGGLYLQVIFILEIQLASRKYSEFERFGV